MFRAILIVGCCLIGWSQVSAAQDVDAILEQIRENPHAFMRKENVCPPWDHAARAEDVLRERAKTLSDKIAENANTIAVARAELDEAVNRPVLRTRRAILEALSDDPKASNKFVAMHGCHAPCRDEKIRLRSDMSFFQDRLTLIRSYINQLETDAPDENFEHRVAALRNTIAELNGVADGFDQRVQSIHARDLEILRLRAELALALAEDQRKATGY